MTLGRHSFEPAPIRMAIPTASDERWELIHPLLSVKPRRYRYPAAGVWATAPA